MKRIIAPLALSLLSTVAVADADDYENLVQAAIADEWQAHLNARMKLAENPQWQLDEMKLWQHNEARPIPFVPAHLIENYRDYQSILPAWNIINYKNFTKKTIEFDNNADYITARDYAMSEINGKIIINTRDPLYSIVQAVNDNVETRISCKSLEIKIDLRLPKRGCTLVYETATRRSDDEIREREREHAKTTMQEQENARKQREDTIKSKVDNVLNRNIVGTSYKLYEPK